MQDLSLQVIKDGEGVSKLLRVNILNTRSKKKVFFKWIILIWRLVHDATGLAHPPIWQKSIEV